jgi:hypothetical protein
MPAVTVDRGQIDRLARPASGAEHVEPQRLGEQCGPDGGRPQHVACEAPIPTAEDDLCLGVRRSVRSIAGPA